MSAGTTESGLGALSAFGQQPFDIAKGLGKQFMGPLRQGFGFGGGGPKFQRRLQRGLDRGSPLAHLVSSVRGMVPGALSRSQEVGADIAGRAPALFDAVQGQVDQFLSNLPNFQAAAGRAGAGAEQTLSDIMTPGRGSALFQQFADPALNMAAQRAAGRGIAGTGLAQGEEEGLLQNLTRDFIAQQGAQQQAAQQNLANIAGLQTGLGQAGIGAAQQPFGLLPALGQALSQEFNLPMSTASNVLGMLQGSQNPAMQLLQLLSPTVGTESGQVQAGLK